MAQHTKEHLLKLLEFLDKEIIHEPGNEWFVNKLQSLLPARKSTAIEHKTLANIEQYLSLDFKLDNIDSIIDYSFVKDDYVRDCFEADFREMIRFRLGTRGHLINFPEFCRFALMQAERLLNLYYQSLGNIQQIRQQIKLYNPKAKGIDDAMSIEAISFAVKLWAYNKEYNVNPIYNVLDKVRMVRNSQSHGSISESEETFFQRHYSQLVSAGYPLLPNCQVNWNELSKDVQLRTQYEQNIKNTTEHKYYIQLTWQRQHPFDEVITALDVLALHVAHSMKS